MTTNTWFGSPPKEQVPNRWAVVQKDSQYIVDGVAFNTTWAAKEYARFCQATYEILNLVQTTLHDTRYLLVGGVNGSLLTGSSFNLHGSLVVKSRRKKAIVSMVGGEVVEINLFEIFLVAVPVDLWVQSVRKACVNLWYGTKGKPNAVAKKSD